MSTNVEAVEPLTPQSQRRRKVAAGTLALASGAAIAGVWAVSRTRGTVVLDVLGLGWGLIVVILAVVSGICGMIALGIGTTLLMRRRSLAPQIIGGVLILANICAGGLLALAAVWLGGWALTDYWWDLGTTADGRHLVVQEQGFTHRWVKLGELRGVTVTTFPDAPSLPEGARGLGPDVHLTDQGTRLRWTDDAGGIPVNTDPAR